VLMWPSSLLYAIWIRLLTALPPVQLAAPALLSTLLCATLMRQLMPLQRALLTAHICHRLPRVHTYQARTPTIPVVLVLLQTLPPTPTVLRHIRAQGLIAKTTALMVARTRPPPRMAFQTSWLSRTVARPLSFQ
jgi:hypothetical protein